MSIHPWRTACAATLMFAPACAVAAQGVDPDARALQAAAAPGEISYPDEGLGLGTTTGGYNSSRWAEDWTRMRDPKKRKDPLDKLKFLPLDPEGNTYLTLSGEMRLRMNNTTNPDLKSAERQRQDIMRVFAGADLHVGEHFRAYGEIAHAGIGGDNLGTPATNLDNKLVFQQYFVDAMAKVGSVDVGARYGRQIFVDGPNLITSARDNNTLLFTFNGWRAWARGKNVRADIFDLKPTEYGREGTDDDKTEHRRRFSGISTSVMVPRDWFGGNELFFDPFVWRLRDRAAVWGGTTAREERKYYGVHVWGDAGPVDLDWTVNHQGGRYDGRRIAAWQIFAAQTYRLGKKKTAPRVGFHADYASGGGAYGTGKLRNALAPFGNNIYYSYQLFATPTNLIAIAPDVSFQVMPKVRLTLEYQMSWRDSVHDAVYRANGSPFVGTEDVRGRKIADTYRAQAVWTISPRVSVTGRYEHLVAGPALSRAGYKSSDFIAGWLQFRF